MKRITLLFLALLALAPASAYSQEGSRILEAKVNLLAGAVTIFNPSIEVGFAKQSAITYDYVGAYSEKDFLNSGHALLLSMSLFSYRHYLKKEHHDGFFVSGDGGLVQYRMDKNVVPLIASDHYGQYDVGYGYVFGVTLGYKRNIGERLSLEASLSGGYQNSRHEQYNSDGSRRHEFNTTAEWTPYKAGIYLGYRFWK